MIIGKDVRLRAMERSDLPLFVSWFADPDVREFLTTRSLYSMSFEEGWYENMLKVPIENHPMMIDILVDNQWLPVGDIALPEINWINRQAEVGVMIGEKAYWNRGFGTQAMRLMLHYAFDTINLNRVYLEVYEPNIRGIHCYEKAGFIKEGCLREAQYLNGKYVNVWMMGILKSEWQQVKE